MPGTARAEPPRNRAVAIFCALLVFFVVATAAWQLYRGDRPFAKTSAAAPLFQLDPNTAPAAELAALPGIGEAVAGRIVTYRTQQQSKGNLRPFASLNDLDAVQGIGPATLEELSPYLSFTTSEEP